MKNHRDRAAARLPSSRPLAGRLARVVLAAAVAILAARSAAAETPVDRTIIGLYDSKTDIAFRRSRLHRLVEMPLNHLGLTVQPHDLRRGLPSEEAMRGVRGIVTWFTSVAAPDSAAYVAWLEAQLRAGRRLVIIDHPGVDPDALASVAARQRFQAVFAHIGLRWEGEWVDLTYSTKIVAKDPLMVEFERPLPRVLPPYLRLTLQGTQARAYLTVRRDSDSRDAALVVTGPNGGYISPHYAILEPPRETEALSWHVNPFRFFREAFGTDTVPKLDTTTLSGRRIYYSHVDGDGWHNISTAMKYAEKRLESAEVLFLDVLRRTPDLPITIAPISGDLDRAWYGDDKTRELARQIFALPQVEAGSHTHSHPLVWGFFRDSDPRRELRYLSLYPPRPGRSQAESVWDRSKLPADLPPRRALDDAIPPGYSTPRSYAVLPFSLEAEVAGSIRIIEQLLPPGKRVALYQWSGDTGPYEQALARVKAAGLRNINGGDSRMDGLFASYAQVQPIGIKVGAERQVYSSASNENTYTDNWRRRFFGFRGLAETLYRTEMPLRVKPINIYYHFYSVEREDGMSAVWHNIEYARAQEIAPIAASRFAAIADGFETARIVALGDRRWRIENRDALETVRFDEASLLAVDFRRSEGAIGQRHFQGSLYVALDGRVAAPIVALTTHDAPHRDPDAPVPYLVHGRWRVYGLVHEAGGFRFTAEGYGAAEFVWKVPAPGRYAIQAVDETGRRLVVDAATAEDGMLRLSIPVPDNRGHGVDFTVTRAN